jgi:hypothetical protein
MMDRLRRLGLFRLLIGEGLTDDGSPIAFASLTSIVVSSGELSAELDRLKKDYPSYFAKAEDKVWQNFLKDVRRGGIEESMSQFWSSCRSVGFKARFLMFYMWDEGILREAVSWGRAVKHDSPASWRGLLRHDYLLEPEYREKIGQGNRSEDMFFLDSIPGELLDFMIRVMIISRKWAISEHARFGSKYLTDVIISYNRSIILILERRESARLCRKHVIDLLRLVIFNSEPFGLGVRYGATELDGFHGLMGNPRISNGMKKEANLIMMNLISQEEDAYIQSVMLCSYTEEMEDSLGKKGYIYGFDKNMFGKSIEFIRNQDNGYPFSPESTLRIFQIWEHYSSLRISLIKDYIQKEHMHYYDYPEGARLTIDNESAAEEWRDVRRILQDHKNSGNEDFLKPMMKEIDAALARWSKNKNIRDDESSLFQGHITKMNLYI